MDKAFNYSPSRVETDHFDMSKFLPTDARQSNTNQRGNTITVLADHMYTLIENDKMHLSEVEKKACIERIIAVHNQKHSTHYSLGVEAHASIQAQVVVEKIRKTVDIVREKLEAKGYNLAATVEKFKQAFPPQAADKASRSSSLPDEIKRVCIKNTSFLKSMLTFYVEQEFVSVEKKADRFKALDREFTERELHKFMKIESVRGLCAYESPKKCVEVLAAQYERCSLYDCFHYLDSYFTLCVNEPIKRI